MPKLPNFFLAGVPKAGTSSLCAYLRQHPDVYVSPIKEPTFFAAADLLSDPYRQQVLRFMERDPEHLRAYLDDTQGARPGKHYILRWDDYIRLFQNVVHETAIGEATVDYFWLPSAAEAIRRRLPDARLIFVLRHPVERLFSWFVISLRRDPRLTFEKWFRTAMRPGSAWWPVVDTGRYATHLERFFGLFPRHQIRIYLYDAYESDARAMVRDIFAFLGVDPSYPIDMARRLNETVVPRSAVVHRLRRRILGNRSVIRRLPEAVKRVLRHLYFRPREDFTLGPEDRRLVIAYYQDEIVRTGELIGQDLSAWLR